ncbi:4-hydroxybenzoate octaprenyltransferase [Streptomyces fuscichromogenes]|uniref:4-hydroxybenzoate polyprenyltransferase n=1 Tax=Streptomyces fuscichromogenes TaxID=1324013 RepID=A0A918CXV6_9ACTN|nr:4-hydroxybenzoate octaprenyltransferase [Streptomyces fuscichromogenes]GGN45425.1 4-hydroxybenzoate octaprenyltransferase [Streptomyces fuscichromogenes]
MRLHAPIGTWLYLFPGLWAVVLAEGDDIRWRIVVAFGLAAVLIRGAGCTINDIVDREIDAQVRRTADRPIPAGLVTVRQATVFAAAQTLAALLILAWVDRTAAEVIAASFLLIVSYPFMKRVTYWPQVPLGLAFSALAPAGWVAVTGSFAPAAWALYAAGFFWTVGHDTVYSHQDKEDDRRIGVKSAALRFKAATPWWLGLFYGATLALLVWTAYLTHAGPVCYPILLIGALNFAWQIAVIREDTADGYLRAFVGNRHFGWIVLGSFLAGKLI